MPGPCRARRPCPRRPLSSVPRNRTRRAVDSGCDVRQLLARGGHERALDALTAREREVLTEMAQGHTNAAIATRLFISRSAVEKHVNAIFTKLDLTALAATTHSRRVLAVLRYLGA
ncbi:LuxR family transcriptional regulator [Streptomyces triticirhizae]|uniref:LuxR family transcriptional regulator n=1 Tax=Streptomyces triticirhizae TaxID=2483353 RepID=A0A3M2LPI5_9ACTN|nr:LuxR family transcriptional regulator [Streptomyces triticirhizae]